MGIMCGSIYVTICMACMVYTMVCTYMYSTYMYYTHRLIFGGIQCTIMNVLKRIINWFNTVEYTDEYTNTNPYRHK